MDDQLSLQFQIGIMRNIFTLLVALLSHLALLAQDSTAKPKDTNTQVYHGFATKINDLVHTKLAVHFDYTKSYLYGKAWITLKPHYYPTDTLSLDAKGMDIHAVALVKGTGTTPLHYSYDGLILSIQLDKTYKNTDSYVIYIDYTSKPNEFKVKGSAAIKEAKGLYFINPLGTEKNKPTQIWTQGETESNSVWFPTIDKPDQKCTEEIIMTVPAKYVTLSNGKLVSQVKNQDGTRTDDWRMDLPHAPYLFFMGVGDYAIVKDSYKGMEVSYYLEHEYAPVARRIFGHTPDMIAFYSHILGMEYPWVKYSQMTARDYVSGAMENTTATLHQESAQQDARELVDGNAWEDVIAHELFHHWFGDLVTTESWSNITLNESFADFSESLWNEHEYGKDAGDAVNYNGLLSYLANPEYATKDLVRYYYNDREDLFDRVSYSKGGRILNMLRTYVGDSAFFKSLNLYLVTNKFKSADADQLREAFEKVTGQDLHWYWDQWYFGSGHPKLTIDYFYDDAAGRLRVVVAQTQKAKIFRLPVSIDVYSGGHKERHRVWLESKIDTLTFSYTKRPDLVNVDADKILVCEKKDNKTLDNYIYQYRYAGLYLDRREAIDFCAKIQDDAKALGLLKMAMKDRFYGLREYAVSSLDLDKKEVKDAVEPVLADLAKNDPNALVRALAIDQLGQYNNATYKPLFLHATGDSSYSVSGNALMALNDIDSADAYKLAEKFAAQPAKGNLRSAIASIFIQSSDLTHVDLITDGFNSMPVSQKKMDALPGFALLMLKINRTDQVEKGVDAIASFRDAIPGDQHDEIAQLINTNILKVLAERKEMEGLKDQADYIKSKLPDGQKNN
jgi:aminopeptidase N